MAERNLSTIIKIISTVGSVAELQADQDFYDAGFTSLNALPLLMEMEDQFQVTIPDDRFISARTPRALLDLITELQ